MSKKGKIGIGAIGILLACGLALAAAHNPKAETLCTTVFERMRSCSATHIPALVDYRISIDQPQGIAQYARESGRDAVVAESFEEWKGDSTDTAIARVCAVKSIGVSSAQVVAAEACLQAASCEGFSACIIPFLFPANR